MDNRVSLAVALQLLDYFEKYPEKLNTNIEVHFSTREETSLGDFSFHREYDQERYTEILVLDAIPTYPPNVNTNFPEIRLGDGVFITRDPEDDRNICRKLASVAETAKIPWQFIYSYGFGSSNNRPYTKFFSAPVQQLNIPVENMYGYIEMLIFEI